MKLFVWDFHGVLEKGNETAVLEITNLALKFHGYSRRMTQVENEFLAGYQWHEYFAFLLPEIEEDEYFLLQSTCIEISHSQPEIISSHIHLNDHADSVLKSIHESQNCQILISNTLPQTLDKFIRLVGVDKYFPPSHCFGVNMGSQKKLTKLDYLDQFLKDRDEAYEAIVSIGDSPGDMTLIEQIEKGKGVGYLYSHPGKEHRYANGIKINDLRVVLQEISHEMTIS